MEISINYNDVIYGYAEEDGMRAIISFRDGTTKISYSNSNLTGFEFVPKFIIFLGDLYAIVSNDNLNVSELIKLSKINEGIVDTWEIIHIFNSDSIHAIEYFEDYIYLFSNGNIYKYDGDTISSVGSMVADVNSVYSTTYFNDYIYLFILDTSNNAKIYEYDGSATFNQLDSTTIWSWPSNFQPVGKRLLIEQDGIIYYSWMDGSEGTLKSFNLDNRILSEEYSLLNNTFTCLSSKYGIIYIGTYDSAVDYNIIEYIPNQFYVENDLVAGEGKVNSSLVRIDSDPIFIGNRDKESNSPVFNEYPVICVLKGSVNPIVKYSSRLEFYTDLNNIENLMGLNLKDLIDEICSLMDATFTVDANNIAKVQKKNLIGFKNEFATLKDDTGYGENYIKKITSVEKYEHNFRRIQVDWNNAKWKDNSPVTVGAIGLVNSPELDLSGVTINNPNLAKNIALYLLNNINNLEIIRGELSFAPFLEGGENLIFKVSDRNVYLDESKEWKIIQASHSKNTMTTSIVALERIILNEKDDI